MLLRILSWERYYPELLYKYIRAEEVSFKLNLFHFLIFSVAPRNNWNYCKAIDFDASPTWFFLCLSVFVCLCLSFESVQIVQLSIITRVTQSFHGLVSCCCDFSIISQIIFIFLLYFSYVITLFSPIFPPAIFAFYVLWE